MPNLLGVCGCVFIFRVSRGVGFMIGLSDIPIDSSTEIIGLSNWMRRTNYAIFQS